MNVSAIGLTTLFASASGWWTTAGLRRVGHRHIGTAENSLKARHWA
jgi:hypothetical protein